MSISGIRISAILAPLLLLVSSQAVAQQGAPLTTQVFANIGATSDYVFRGLSQSDGDAVGQGSLDVVTPSGIYAGVWASGVDKPFGAVYNQVGGDEDLEYDVYLGWNKNVGSGINLDGGVIRYGFEPDDDEISWTEAYLGLTAEGLNLKASVRVEGSEIFGEYLEVNYRKSVGGVTLKAHAGHFYLDEEVRLIDEYSDYYLGAAKTFHNLGRLNVELRYHFADGDARDRYTVANDKLVLTVSRNFKLTK